MLAWRWLYRLSLIWMWKKKKHVAIHTLKEIVTYTRESEKFKKFLNRIHKIAFSERTPLYIRCKTVSSELQEFLKKFLFEKFNAFKTRNNVLVVFPRGFLDENFVWNVTHPKVITYTYIPYSRIATTANFW